MPELIKEHGQLVDSGKRLIRMERREQLIGRAHVNRQPTTVNNQKQAIAITHHYASSRGRRGSLLVVSGAMLFDCYYSLLEYSTALYS